MGKKPALWCGWSRQQKRGTCYGRAIQWLNWEDRALCNASQTPATDAHNSLWAPTSGPVPDRHTWGHPAAETYARDHSPLLHLCTSLHSPLIPPCFLPAKWLHPVIPVCGDCIVFPKKGNKLRTLLCSFLPSLLCFVTLLQEASGMLKPQAGKLVFYSNGKRDLCCEGQRNK